MSAEVTKRFRIATSAALFCIVSVVGAHAKTVRCETTSKTDKFVPDWIEYTVRETDVDVKDSVQKQYQAPWQPGRVSAQTAKRTTIAWDVGPINSDRFWRPAPLQMRLSHFSDGSFRLTIAAPQLKYANNQGAIEGQGRCK
ncbi:hypothetical protein ACSBLW_03360 [Thioclava sp. FR2]|uniref:hypothetical protein n=1 Tax=Thioclava sp. FR2 TaxID=3445780 RepID=UPI003EBAA8C3